MTPAITASVPVNNHRKREGGADNTVVGDLFRSQAMHYPTVLFVVLAMT
ncbi:hypothetical protein [Enterobacter cloacae complex sp. ESBL7]